MKVGSGSTINRQLTKRTNHKQWIWRCFFYFWGLWFVALGAAFTIQGQLGVASWDVLHIGLAKVTSLPIGFCSIIVGAIILAILFYLDKKRIKWGLLGNLLLVGIFLDVILYFQLVPFVQGFWEKWLWLVTGLVFFSFGLSSYIVADFGAGPRDSLMLALSERSGLSVRMIRTIMEVFALGVGWLLGGPVSMGTVVLTLATGPMLQLFLGINRRFLRYLTNNNYKEMDI